MSFNDFAKKEAADRKALQEKDQQSQAATDQAPPPGSKSAEPSTT